MFTATIIRRVPGKVNPHLLTIEVRQDNPDKVMATFDIEVEDLEGARILILDYLRTLTQRWTEADAEKRFVGKQFALEGPIADQMTADVLVDAQIVATGKLEPQIELNLRKDS